MHRGTKRRASEPPALHNSRYELIEHNSINISTSGQDLDQGVSEEQELERLKMSASIFRAHYNATKSRLRSLLEIRELRSLHELLPTQISYILEAAKLMNERFEEYQKADAGLKELEQRRAALQTELRKLGVKHKVIKATVVRLQGIYETAENDWLAKDARRVKMNGRIKELEEAAAQEPGVRAESSAESMSTGESERSGKKAGDQTDDSEEDSEQDQESDEAREAHRNHNYPLRSRRSRRINRVEDEEDD